MYHINKYMIKDSKIRDDEQHSPKISDTYRRYTTRVTITSS